MVGRSILLTEHPGYRMSQVLGIFTPAAKCTQLESNCLFCCLITATSSQCVRITQVVPRGRQVQAEHPADPVVTRGVCRLFRSLGVPPDRGGQAGRVGGEEGAGDVRIPDVSKVGRGWVGKYTSRGLFLHQLA